MNQRITWLLAGHFIYRTEKVLSSKERSFYLVQTNEIEPLTSLLWIRNQNFGTNPHPLSLNKWGDFHWHRFFLKTLIGFYQSRWVGAEFSWPPYVEAFILVQHQWKTQPGVHRFHFFIRRWWLYRSSIPVLKSIALLVLRKSIGF